MEVNCVGDQRGGRQLSVVHGVGFCGGVRFCGGVGFLRFSHPALFLSFLQLNPYSK